MRQYPRFLNSMPVFLGISFPEVGIILISLWLCLILSCPSYYALIFSLIGILISKIIRKNFDLIGFVVPRKKELFLRDYKWRDHDSSL